MRRTIVGFRQDDAGDWVADLSCLHSQHVRHQPPFRLAPWVLEESGRADRVGTELHCPILQARAPGRNTGRAPAARGASSKEFV